MIQLTCEQWDDLLQADREPLLALYETLLSRHARRLSSHRTLHRYAHLLSEAVDIIHDQLYDAMTMVADDVYYGAPIELRLVGWCRFQPVFDMQMRPNPSLW